ncbi:MAG: hypothetical protein GX567_06875, partial [Clostridia bacterium]|nr:hypothetical protein [Clostridia bacterium]
KYAVEIENIGKEAEIMCSNSYLSNVYQFIDQKQKGQSFIGYGDENYWIDNANESYRGTPRLKLFTTQRDMHDQTSIDTCEVEVKGNYTYTGEAIIPQVTVKRTTDSGQVIVLTPQVDYELSYLDNVNAGNAKILIKGIGAYHGELTKVFQIAPVTLNQKDAKITVIGEYEIFLAQIKPSLSVMYQNKKLCRDVDYLVDECLIEKGWGKRKATIQGTGNYKGTLTYEIMIHQCDISDMTYQIEEEDMPVFTGYPVTVSGEFYDREGNWGFSIKHRKSYVNNVHAGKHAQLHIRGVNDYKGMIDTEFTIRQADLLNTNVELLETPTYTDGKEVCPAIRVKLGSYLLTEGVDYRVYYENNTEITTEETSTENQPTIVLLAKNPNSGDFTGVKKVPFVIHGKSIAKAKAGLKNPKEVYQYDGVTPHCPEVYVKLNGVLLNQDQDYSVSYRNQTDAGIATAVITGIGIYEGKIEIPYTIKGTDIRTCTVEPIKNVPYDYGHEIKPDIIVKTSDGSIVDPLNYDVVYEHNQNVGRATAYVIGKGSYSGSKKVTFIISKRPI